MKDVIFIGAGPIGLLSAIQLKLKDPQLQITMFEKYVTPLRTHNMYVDHDVFSGMDVSQGFDEVLKSIHKKVMISDLETKLRAFAKKIDIEIKFEPVTSFDELKKQYPDTKYFVGSGGLNGLLQAQLFNRETQINDTLRYAAEVKYKAVGRTRSLNKVTQLSGVHTFTNHLVSEYVGRQNDDGLTPVSLRIFVDADTYEKMKGATNKNPYTLSDTDALNGRCKIEPRLLDSIETYMEARLNMADEFVQEGSLKIWMLTLSIIASKDFYKELDGTVVFKIGEEAFACPFYRSFNDNAKCVNAFVEALLTHRLRKADIIQDVSVSSFAKISSLMSAPPSPLEEYAQAYQSMVNKEFKLISLLNTGINAIESSVVTSREFPPLRGVAVSKMGFTHGGRAFAAQQEERRRDTLSTEEVGVGKKLVGCTLV